MVGATPQQLKHMLQGHLIHRRRIASFIICTGTDLLFGSKHVQHTELEKELAKPFASVRPYDAPAQLFPV
jgi:hypothetical protein